MGLLKDLEENVQDYPDSLGMKDLDEWKAMIRKIRKGFEANVRNENDDYPEVPYTVIDRLSARIIILSKMLQVNAEATQGRGRDTGERTKVQKKMLSKMPEDNKFLAKPKVQ